MAQVKDGAQDVAPVSPGQAPDVQVATNGATTASPAPAKNKGQTEPASAYLSGEAQGMPATVDKDVFNMANWGSSKYGFSSGKPKIEAEDLAQAPGAASMTPSQLSQAAALATGQMQATRASRSTGGIAQEALAVPGAAVRGKLPGTIQGKGMADYGGLAGTSDDPRRLGLAKTIPGEWINTTNPDIKGKPAAAPAAETGDNRPSMGEGMYNGGNSKEEKWNPANLPNDGESTPKNAVAGNPQDIVEKAKTLNPGDWSGFFKLAGNLLDAYGVSRSAYGGVQRKTMLQQEFANKLQIEQQKQQAQNQAKATISTLEPKAAAQIEQIRAEYEASGDKDVYVSKLNQARNLQLITAAQMTKLLNLADNPGDLVGGGRNAALDALKGPGGYQ